ncbi:hypothetical protein HPB47_014559 [Ixodes persulcatus]|uniref:Uncharacterized protein n=1 Tax=Ixodes persulcatus TaxID=34615 RepID=A0AC60QWK4_IXOPE|nr:hypothetical protein HPB47_014559 [Ixodes persulcatus]
MVVFYGQVEVDSQCFGKKISGGQGAVGLTRKTSPEIVNYKCKHVVAMLLHINVKTNFNALASTDLPQKCGKGQKRAVGEKYAPRKIVNLPGLENFDAFVEEIRATFSADICAVIEERTREQSLFEDWLRQRIGMATSTVCHSFKTKAAKCETEQMPYNIGPLLKAVLRTSTYQSAAMQRGLSMEGTARDKYVSVVKSRGHTCTVEDRGLLIGNEFPVMGCSVEGLVTFTCACCKGEKPILEIKCLNAVKNAFSKDKPTPLFYTQI